METQGYATRAGRGWSWTANIAPQSPPAFHTFPDPIARVRPPTGRASQLKNALQLSQQLSLAENGSNSQIQTHLRQAIPIGYSNDMIEENFGKNVGATKSTITVPVQKNVVLNQFLDAEDDSGSEVFPSVCATMKTTKVKSTSKGKGKRVREFRKVLVPSEELPNCTTVKPKFISEIFRNKPPDYQRSYFAMKKDPYLLNSRDDFPPLK